MAEQRTPASLDEIRALLGELPGPDLEARAAAAERQAALTKPAGALGRLEDLALWLATNWWVSKVVHSIDERRFLAATATS